MSRSSRVKVRQLEMGVGEMSGCEGVSQQVTGHGPHLLQVPIDQRLAFIRVIGVRGDQVLRGAQGCSGVIRVRRTDRHSGGWPQSSLLLLRLVKKVLGGSGVTRKHIVHDSTHTQSCGAPGD